MVEGGLPIFDDIRGLAVGLPMRVVIVGGLVASGLLRLCAPLTALAVRQRWRQLATDTEQPLRTSISRRTEVA